MLNKWAGTEAKQKSEEYWHGGGNAVDHTDFHNANKYLDYIGDVALIGGGVGLGWYSLKKLVERSYQKRLEKAIRSSNVLKDSYTSRDLPVQNTFIGADGLSKQATGSVEFSNHALRKGIVTDDVRSVSKPGNTIFLKPGQGLRTTLTSEMASHPHVWNSLAFAAVPLTLAGTLWGGNVIAKRLNKALGDDAVRGLKEEHARAKAKYDRAARALRKITQEEL